MQLRTIFRLVLLTSVISLPVDAGEISKIITVNDSTYEIFVDGFRDPINESIIIENLGEEPLINPRITVNGKYDWFDLESMAQEATRGCKTDRERSFALFNFVRENFQHLDSPGDREAHNPVVSLNVYGYANCAYHSTALVSLSRALGMKARVWEVWHHTVSENWYDDAWHMLDSDIGLYHLMDDNLTIASIEQLHADQKVSGGNAEGAHKTKWSGRNKAIPSEYFNADESETYLDQDGKTMRGYRYYFDKSSGWVYVQKGYDKWAYEPHDMAMVLRPQEQLIRHWKGNEKFYDYNRHNADFKRDGARYRKPILYGNGQLIWAPDLNSETLRNAVDEHYCAEFSIDNGVPPAIHVRHRGGGLNDLPNFVRFSVHTPYTIVGGRLRATMYKGGASRYDDARITLSGPLDEVEKEIWKAPKVQNGNFDIEVDLDEVLYPGGPRGRHEYTTAFVFEADQANEPPTQSGVDSVRFETDIQCAPNSLPALSLGRNVVRYWDETPGPHKVKITHVWKERNDNHPPQAPSGALYPLAGSTVDDLAPKFEWAPAEDADAEDIIADHEIMISLDPQCRWPVATALRTWTASGEPEWQLAEGWLNTDTHYYWKVRARDSRKVWGNWSTVFKFRTPE